MPGQPEPANGRVAELAMTPGADVDSATAAVRQWISTNVPSEWQKAARRGGAAAIRKIRPFAEYHEWYPLFARSG
jgi:hypothetical protein